jgi:hypothetical protein
MLKELIKKFLVWSRFLRINSKDYGLIRFNSEKWWGSQKRLLKAIYNADEEQRTFVILKARQLGITSICNALTLFYHQYIPNSKGAIFVANYNDIDYIRRTILHDFYDMIDEKVRVILTHSSREGLRFANNSTVHFIYTAKKITGQGKAGRGRGYNYLHATEVAYFNSWEDLNAIQASLSDIHPQRLYIYESTANGYNEFYDLYELAKTSPSMKAVFIGWWTKETYRLSPDSNIYKHYSYPPNSEEREWIKAVKRLYGYEITIEQLAWWRYQMWEKYRGNKIYALQELPFFEDQAFQLSGDRFFDSVILKQYEEALKKEYVNGTIKEKFYRLTYDVDRFIFEETTLEKANLIIWEYPSAYNVYVIGADPTMAANPDSDNAVISVWRCEEDKIVQVAELVDNQIPPQIFARYILLLGGLYNGAYVNLEVTGPGQSTLKEFDYLKAQGWVPDVVMDDITKEVLQNNIRYIRDYLYYRADSFRRSFLRHWKTTPDLKVDLMQMFRGCVNEKKTVIRSKELLKEMAKVVKNGSIIEAEKGFHDDRVIAAALAVEYWIRYLRGKVHLLKQRAASGPKILKIGNVTIPL